MTIHFEVLGPPIALKTHRTGPSGRYDPSAADKADFLALSRDNAPDTPIQGWVMLYLVFWMPIPKSARKRLRVAAEEWDATVNTVAAPMTYYWNAEIAHTKRPDTDNLIKLVKDALTGVYWQDDSQVQIGCAYKLYSHRPRTEVEVLW